MFFSFSLSLATLLLEGHNELPGFNILRQADLLREELLHISGDVQVFALHVRHQCDFQAPLRPVDIRCVCRFKDQHHELMHLQKESVSAVLREEASQQPVLVLTQGLFVLL